MPNTSPVPMTSPMPNSNPVPTTNAGVAVLVSLPTTRHEEPDPESFTIDCGDCRHQDTPVCDDCVVSFIVGRRPDDAVVVDADEARAVRMLEHAGLVPGVRHSLQAAL